MDGLVWLAVSVTVFMGDNSDGSPAVDVAPGRYYATAQECEDWRADRYAHTWGVVDPVTGRAVSAYYYECTPRFAQNVQIAISPFTTKGLK